MKYAVLLAALLTASIASAEDDVICWGSPITAVTPALASDSSIVGTAPLLTERKSCGGGLDPLGEPIPRWDCLTQTWALKIEGNVGRLIAVYSRHNDRWLLAGLQLCNTDLNRCIPFPGVEQCKGDSAGKL